MQFFLTLILFSCATFTNVQSQPIPFDRSGLSFYYELINPRWRNHRSRLRPFTNVLGSPVANIRGARSTKEAKKPSELEPKAACFYTFESLHCAGITGENSQSTTVQCDAKENFDKTQLSNAHKFSMSDVRIIRYANDGNNNQNETISKIYLFAEKMNNTWFDYRLFDNETNKINIFSIHSVENSNTDKGITVLDKECWNRMVHFFMSIRVADEVMVNKTPFVLPVKTIANLQIF